MSKNPRYKRVQKQRDADLKLIVQYLNEGKTWQELTDLINSQRPYVCTLQNYYLQYYKDLKKNTPEPDLNEHRERQLGEIQLLKDELMKEWQSSRGKVKKITTKGIMNDKGGDGDGLTRKEKTVVEELQNANAAYLAQYARLLERESKLLGLDSPEQQQVIQKTEHSFEHMTLEEKAQLLELIDKANKAKK